MKEYSASIVFDGSKYFQKLQCKLDLMIVKHVELCCLELIVFIMGVNSQPKTLRMYINAEILLTKLDIEMFNTTLAIKKRSLRRLGVEIDIDELMKTIAVNMMNSMIVSRLELVNMDGSSGMFEMFLQPNPSDTVIATSKDMTSINAKIDFQYEHKPDGLVAYKGFMKALQGHKTTQCTSPRSPATPCVIVMTPVTPSRLLPSILIKTLPSVVLKSLPCSPAVPRGAMFPSVKTSHQVAQLTSTTLSTTATGNTVVSIETAGWPGQLSRANSRVVSRPGTPQMVPMSPVVQALQTLFNDEIHALSSKSAHASGGGGGGGGVLQRGLSDLSEGNGSVSSSVPRVSTRCPIVQLPPISGAIRQ